MFCRTGLTSKVMDTSSKTTTGSAESELCSVWETSPEARSAGIGRLPAKDTDHGSRNEQIDDDDEDRGDHDGLGGRSADALSSTFGVHAEVTADGGDDES